VRAVLRGSRAGRAALSERSRPATS
jgi:hypothetical protein